MPTLCIRKNDTTYKLPLMPSAKYASPAGVPCFCVQHNKKTWYAKTSNLETNAVMAFPYKDKTYYIVSKHEDSEIKDWVEIYSNETGEADEFVLPDEYNGCRIKIECGGEKGEDGENGGDDTSSWVFTVYNYGGAGGAGGYGGEAETYAGECKAGTIFNISTEGFAGEAGTAGGTGSSVSNSFGEDSGEAGGNGGEGGKGFSVSCKNAAGETKTCTAYGGGGGGGGGGCGGHFNYWAWLDYHYAWGKSGTAGTGGASGENAGGEGSESRSSGTADANSGGTYYINSSRSYSAGGEGGSSGENEEAYCRIKVGVLR